MSGLIFLILRMILAVLLYSFLGWALWILWQDLRQQGRISSTAIPALALASQVEGERVVRKFTGTEVLVGRDPACDLYLDERTVSTRHARLSYHHGQWWLEDMHSRNGTFLNEEALSTPVVLAAGDQIRFGQAAFQVVLGEAAALREEIPCN
ncbi:MAG: FHA domain-containing protein [Chloroflexota bacterium]